MEDANRELARADQDYLYEEKNTPVCIDCKTWEGNYDVIVLCPFHKDASDLINRWFPGSHLKDEEFAKLHGFPVEFVKDVRAVIWGTVKSRV